MAAAPNKTTTSDGSSPPPPSSLVPLLNLLPAESVSVHVTLITWQPHKPSGQNDQRSARARRRGGGGGEGGEGGGLEQVSVATSPQIMRVGIEKCRAGLALLIFRMSAESIVNANSVTVNNVTRMTMPKRKWERNLRGTSRLI